MLLLHLITFSNTHTQIRYGFPGREISPPKRTLPGIT